MIIVIQPGPLVGAVVPARIASTVPHVRKESAHGFIEGLGRHTTGLSALMETGGR